MWCSGSENQHPSPLLDKVAAQSQKSISNLGKAIRKELCEIKRKQMTRIAQEARKNPAGVAILERGQMAIARGEILILARCKPEIATLRDVDTCYQDLPIIHRGHHMFRDSMTYAVRTSSYETPCNSHFKPVHFISGYYRSQKSKNTLSNIK